MYDILDDGLADTRCRRRPSVSRERMVPELACVRESSAGQRSTFGLTTSLDKARKCSQALASKIGLPSASSRPAVLDFGLVDSADPPSARSACQGNRSSLSDMYIRNAMPICLRLLTQDSRCRLFLGFAATGVLLAVGAGVLPLVVGAVSLSEVGASPQPVIARSADKAIVVWIVCLIFMSEKLFWVWRGFFDELRLSSCSSCASWFIAWPSAG